MTAHETRSDPNRELTERTIRELYDAEPVRLSVERLSELIGARKETIYKMLDERSIPGVQLPSGRWVIYSASIRDWLIGRLDVQPQTAQTLDEGEN